MLLWEIMGWFDDGRGAEFFGVSTVGMFSMFRHL